ncbi:hypothetical protein DSM100688_0410 [Bifidobacterium ramosum]|uniref:Uncharacterized protein n=1 Tax=Bifidobacterium ramosum TaxID=1798158 RepID=A0A6L4X319_9BIFI|nr:hypothetical protein [Bifidobacterium ramosum]KAB8289330.1 hypothetical protein DSM100688_0410 [Bifidobacterium ramosum]NEG71030.1 hypothetical protein [Bifidobacterium ramosum]
MTTIFPTPRQRSMHALTSLDLDLNALSKPETFILGYELAWQESRLLIEDIVEAINQLENQDAGTEEP